MSLSGGRMVIAPGSVTYMPVERVRNSSRFNANEMSQLMDYKKIPIEMILQCCKCWIVLPNHLYIKTFKWLGYTTIWPRDRFHVYCRSLGIDYLYELNILAYIYALMSQYLMHVVVFFSVCFVFWFQVTKCSPKLFESFFSIFQYLIAKCGNDCSLWSDAAWGTSVLEVSA